MEIDVLPPLFMRSIILSCMKLPSLKRFVAGLMQRLVKRAIWLDPDLFEGFIRVLEMLDSESVRIIAQMPPEQIASVLKRSKRLVSVSKKHFSTVKDIKDKNERRYRSILMSLR